ncbi:hypothetical protein BM525_19180 (plasmid) [Alteromonas mediterranea]|uniref:Uncharacterized protein n=2 Tax=Alteromonas mediterranea TaxID=314275 RepID=A0AAC9JHU2_9ALTE|nr:hypothetical protein BM524_18985 [Alteromonas mediterranea]APD99862.1 hypothetical protein BM525_19180 [Alteromonas mediterranea]
MAILTLNEKLLNVLSAMKARQELAIIEASIDGFPDDWLSELRRYYASFPTEVLLEVGLLRNESCFRAIQRLTIPDEWLNTQADELHKFSFSY